MSTDPANDDADLAAALTDFTPGDAPLTTKLRTSERVLARVTDGIYRQPGSALRELISNAYDADASKVTINLDRPRFDRVTVSDNGQGMSPRVLQHLLHNIGGSAKRTATGSTLGVTDRDDQSLSPNGRRLIGKIGIGLFSVAQLTQTFEISTKVKGDKFSSVASVVLRQYSETTTEVGADGKYEAGEVLLWREPAEDRESQGTTITLTSVRPQTRDVLRSVEIWQKVAAADSGDGRPVDPPMFHVGLLDEEEDRLKMTAKLPWESAESDTDAFTELAVAPRRADAVRRSTPSYEEIFDEYLQTIWRLGLSAPLPYFDVHPFDLTGSDEISVFRANGQARREAEEIQLGAEQTIRDAIDFEAPTNCAGFDIQIDDVDLARPISFRNQPRTSAALQRPILMVGRYRTEFSKRSRAFSGGALDFTAYLFWTPKLIPADHRGVLIRVNEASGTLFQPDFLRFPVNEQRRLPQITSEIFIHEGFDGALNIDRESFNHSHPHVVTLTRWFHGSLRQLINTQKRLGTRAAASQRRATQQRASAIIRRIVEQVWLERQEGEEPPPVLLLPDMNAQTDAPSDAVRLPATIVGSTTGANAGARQRQREEVVEAIAQVLLAYDVFAELMEDEQVDLVRSLFELATAVSR